MVTNPDGQLLLGRRNNAPACSWRFKPGGWIRKTEPFQQAMARVALDELGLPTDMLGGAILRGVWDHFYPDSAYSPVVSTHYVKLPHWLQLSWQDINHLTSSPINNTRLGNGWMRLKPRPMNPCIPMCGLMRRG
ncbi:NUDIX domain-containing protein [bacterium]|nr:NUDIX domain-containing protein [bacterium]